MDERANNGGDDDDNNNKLSKGYDSDEKSRYIYLFNCFPKQNISFEHIELCI